MNKFYHLLLMFFITGCTKMNDNYKLSTLGKSSITKSANAQTLAQFDANFGLATWQNKVIVYRYFNDADLLFIYKEENGTEKVIYKHKENVYNIDKLVSLPDKQWVYFNGTKLSLYSEEEWGKRSH